MSINEQSVVTSPHSNNKEVFVSTEERRIRAMVLDEKLEDALLESFKYMAEIIDEKLYLELGYENAREYFAQKQMTARQAYDYALIGRTYKPYIEEPKHREKLNSLGKSKLEILARKAHEKIGGLMDDGKIILGDEVYTDEEIQNMTVRDLNDRLKKANKKFEQMEVLSEQKKNAEMERDHLKKEIKDLRERDAKYRDRSVTQDQVEEDLDEISRAWEKIQKLITRIDVTDCPEDVKLRLVDRINSLQKGGERLAEIHAETLLIYNEHAPSIDSLDI